MGWIGCTQPGAVVDMGCRAKYAAGAKFHSYFPEADARQGDIALFEAAGSTGDCEVQTAASRRDVLPYLEHLLAVKLHECLSYQQSPLHSELGSRSIQMR